MNPTITLSIVAWAWTLLAIAAIVISIVAGLELAGDEEWPGVAISLLALLAAEAFLFGSLYLVGHPLLAAWSLRVSSGLATLLAIGCLVLCLKDEAADGPAVAAITTVLILSLIQFVCSIYLINGLTILESQQRIPADKLVFVSQVALWHNIALAAVGIGTVMFLFLFVRAVGRGSAPGIESHWGGLGGGLSGWEMSASLTYFIGCLVFGILFVLLATRGIEAPSQLESQPPSSSLFAAPEPRVTSTSGMTKTSLPVDETKSQAGK